MALILGNAINNTRTGTANDDAMLGFGGNDTLNGAAGNDGISGGTGRDFIDGDAGDDGIDGGSGNDTLNGSNGNDSIFGAEGDDTLNGGNDDDELDGGDGNDVLSGLNDDDVLDGGAGNDTLQGGNGNDELRGLVGDDIVRGGNGTDQLYGGAADPGDADRFVFDDGNSGTGAVRDVIQDFNDSAAGGEDVIDLEEIDANLTAGFAGDQDFTFITGAFNGVGQLRVVVDAANVNNRIVEFSNDLDASADGQILLAGIGAANITAADFDL